MKHLLLAVAALTVSAHAQTAATLVPAQSEIVFTSTQMGVPVEGRFRRFDATIALDPKQPQAGSVALAIDTSSATLRLAEIDAELAKPGWFDTHRFPQASFRSTAIKAEGGGRFEVTGTLSIKGVAQPLVVPVTLTQNGTTSTATGRFTIKRGAFKIGDGEWSDPSLVADEVGVRFKLVLTGVPPI
ncbi:MAG TPA: YceI family protein [Burkholderiaceae bacterium]|nr:YceI family protein [Burkholderiaceae bacterium]